MKTNTSTALRPFAVVFALAIVGLIALVLAGSAFALPIGGGGGCGDSGCGPQNQPPVARFTISPNPALAGTALVAENHAIPVTGVGGILGRGGDTVTFNGSSSTDDHGIVKYQWDLGTGTYVNGGKTITSSYNAVGKYTIHLKVTDGAGSSDIATEYLTVHARPFASLKATPSVPLIGQQIALDASASTVAQGNGETDSIVKYEWDLNGDGTYDATTTTPQETTSFQTLGTHNVGLRVTSAFGTQSTTTVAITVNRVPTAAFTDAPSPAFVGEKVTFDGSSSSDDAPIADYAWDLDGNGSFETDSHANPKASMTYTTPGTRTVALRVTDSHGVTDIVTHTLVVEPAPVNGKGTTMNGNGTVDTTAPKVAISPKVAKLSKTGAVALKVTCPVTERLCQGSLSLSSVRGAHTARLGSHTFRLGGGQSSTLHIRLSAANRKLVKRLGKLSARATATAKDAAGNVGTSKATLTIKR